MLRNNKSIENLGHFVLLVILPFCFMYQPLLVDYNIHTNEFKITFDVHKSSYSNLFIIFTTNPKRDSSGIASVSLIAQSTLFSTLSILFKIEEMNGSLTR